MRHEPTGDRQPVTGKASSCSSIVQQGPESSIAKKEVLRRRYLTAQSAAKSVVKSQQGKVIYSACRTG
ncbi:protein of unknown function [Serratia sp. Tan611]|nr:protein of unknown function [Serratia sp. Tan611]